MSFELPFIQKHREKFFALKADYDTSVRLNVCYRPICFIRVNKS